MDIDSLAKAQHEIWSRWMKWQFSCCNEMPHTGSLIIPGDKVERWKRQMNTPFDQLSEEEKETDRMVAKEFLSILKDN